MLSQTDYAAILRARRAVFFDLFHKLRSDLKELNGFYLLNSFCDGYWRGFIFLYAVSLNFIDNNGYGVVKQGIQQW